MKFRFEPKRMASAALMAAGCALQALAQSDPGQTAFSLEREGKTVEAEAAWKEISLHHPSSSEPLAHLGLLEARQEHYTQAIAYYRKAMALNPAMPGLQLNLGLAYFKAGDYKRAIVELDPLLKAQPGNQRLIILIGMSYYGLGQFAAAAPYLKQGVDSDPQNLNLLLTLAHSCLLSSQYQCVLDAYHRIIALNAESAEADMLVGEALDEMKDTEGAIGELRAAIAANPNEPNAHFGLGYLLWTKGDYPEAARQFQAEIDNAPEHFQATLYLANSYIQMSKQEDAKPLLLKLVKVNPASSMAHLDLGMVYADEGQNQEALKEFQSAAKLAPNDVNAHWRLGRLYRSMGKKTLAESEFDKAKNLNKAVDDRLLKVMSKIPAAKQEQNGAATAPEK